MLELAADGFLILMIPTSGEQGARNDELSFQVRTRAREAPAIYLLLTVRTTPPAGFEPATGCLEGSCSIQLS